MRDWKCQRETGSVNERLEVLMRDFAAVGPAFIGNSNDGSGHVDNRSGVLSRVNESEPGGGTAACALGTWTRCRSGVLELLCISRRSG